MKRIELTTQITADDTEKYKYKYVFPTSLVALKSAYYDSSYENAVHEFESTPTYLNTDADPVYIAYMATVDETSFPQYFINYFRIKLALDCSFSLTGDTELMKMLAVQEQKELRFARNSDAKQGPNRTIKASPFTLVRN